MAAVYSREVLPAEYTDESSAIEFVRKRAKELGRSIRLAFSPTDVYWFDEQGRCFKEAGDKPKVGPSMQVGGKRFLFQIDD